MDATNSSGPLPAQAKVPPARKSVRWVRVLTAVAATAVCGIVGLLLIRFGGLESQFRGLTRPTLVPASGQVQYQGEPLRNAQIVTHPVGRGLPALGWTDDAGEFTLQTDIDGAYVEGASMGEHRVTVTSYQLISAPAAPPLLTPERYASPGTTPLQITIGSKASENRFQFVLEGEPPSRPERGGGGGGKGGGKGKGKKAKGPPPTSAQDVPAEAEEPASEPQADVPADSPDATQPESKVDRPAAEQTTPKDA